MGSLQIMIHYCNMQLGKTFWVFCIQAKFVDKFQNWRMLIFQGKLRETGTNFSHFEIYLMSKCIKYFGFWWIECFSAVAFPIQNKHSYMCSLKKSLNLISRVCFRISFYVKSDLSLKLKYIFCCKFVLSAKF